MVNRFSRATTLNITPETAASPQDMRAGFAAF
jgi:hypothetical protein